MNNKNNIIKLVIFQVLIIGTFAPLSKYVYNAGVDPLNFSSQILFTASMILLLFTFTRGQNKILRIPLKHILYLIAIGIIGGGLAHSLFSSGLKFTTAINCSFIMQGSIIFIPILSYFLLKEHLKFYKIILIITLAIGVYLVTTSGRLIVPQSGDLLILLSSLSFSIGMVLSKITLKEIPVITFSIYRALFGSIAIFLYLFFADLINPDISWLWVLSGGSLIAIGTMITNTLIKNTTASYVSMMSMSIPVVTIVFAYIFLGEDMTAIQIIGGCIVVLSGVYVHRMDV